MNRLNGHLVITTRRLNSIAGDILPGTPGVVVWGDAVRNDSSVAFVGIGQRWNIPLDALRRAHFVDVVPDAIKDDDAGDPT
jgi:hypothetical protein